MLKWHWQGTGLARKQNKDFYNSKRSIFIHFIFSTYILLKQPSTFEQGSLSNTRHEPMNKKNCQLMKLAFNLVSHIYPPHHNQATVITRQMLTQHQWAWTLNSMQRNKYWYLKQTYMYTITLSGERNYAIPSITFLFNICTLFSTHLRLALGMQIKKSKSSNTILRSECIR